MYKRRSTGGKKNAWRKKRKYELGRPPAKTKLPSNKTVRRIRFDTRNYSWWSEAGTRKTRNFDVVYNPSNNEPVCTQTLFKSAIVQVDAAPFKQWYLQHYGVDISHKKKTIASAKKEGKEGETATEEVKEQTCIEKTREALIELDVGSSIEEQ